MPPKSRPTTNTPSKPKTKFTPRPPTSPEEKLKKLYAGLVDQINEGYYDNAVRTCRKILTIQPTSKPTYKTLLFLLLQTDRYADALEVFEKYSPSSTAAPAEGINPGETVGDKGEFDFEKAYCLYRLHRPAEALKLIDAGREEEGETVGGYEEDENRKVGHLKGQILYRAGDYERAEKVYEELLDTCPADSPESGDITDNLASTQTHLEFQRTGYRVQLGGAFRQGDDVERDLPALPKREAGGVRAAQASGSGTAAASGSKEKKDAVAGQTRRTRHKLPKGVKNASEPFEEDPDRWLPLPLRRSYQQSQLAAGGAGQKKKKKGGKEVSGLGMQGAVGGDEGKGGGGGGSGGQKGKKGKKGK